MPQKMIHQFIEKAILDSNGKKVRSPTFDTSKFDKFLLMVKLGEQGTATGSYVQIRVYFIGLNGVRYLYSNMPFGSLYDSDETIPLKYCVSGECVGSLMQVEVEVTKGTTLDGSNYFECWVAAEFMTTFPSEEEEEEIIEERTRDD